MSKVILVNKNNKKIGLEDKLVAHQKVYFTEHSQY